MHRRRQEAEERKQEAGGRRQDVERGSSCLLPPASCFLSSASCLLPPAACRAIIWSFIFGIIGVVLVLLYPDADQQDSGYHFLFARWGWQHPEYLVNVWARPLFTLVYSFPSQFGYLVAKLFTLAVCLATGYQTFRLAQQLKLDLPELAIPLLFLQPSFFLLSPVVLTEPLFTLILAVALRLHLAGWVRVGMFVGSLLILIRPEGLFIGLLWGFWIFWTQRYSRKRWRESFEILILVCGMLLWWIASVILTRDPLWIAHNWPREWQPSGGHETNGSIWRYVIQLPLIVGPLLLAPFFVGLFQLLKRRQFTLGTSSFLSIFVLHSLMYWRGWFGSAGYARYLVCVSPVIALIALVGWKSLADGRSRFFNTANARFGVSVLVLSLAFCLAYVDGWQYSRDAIAIREMKSWFEANVKPVSRLICSQAYMRIVFDRDPRENPVFTGDRERNLELVRQSPGRTLVFWDEETGPKWYQIRANDFESAGFDRLKSQAYRIEGKFYTLSRNGYGGPRIQQLHMFYKD
jgi:hypothetical protein